MTISKEDQAKIDSILADANAPVTFAEPEAPSQTLDELIAAARSNLKLPEAIPAGGSLEAPDANLVNTLLARADDFKRTADAATAEREKIKKFLNDLIVAAESTGNGESIAELTVHGATVYTYKKVVSRVLDQPHIKSLFPDITENAEMWKDQVSRRAEFK